MTDYILRPPKTIDRTGQSRSSFYQRLSDGLWTKPVSIGIRSVGWPESEVNTLVAALIAGKTDAEIRELVSQLHAKRAEQFAQLTS